MFTFVVRNGHESPDDLIEFRKGSGTKEMIEALKKVLTTIEAKTEKKEDLWFNDEMLYHMNSAIGKFEISADVWNDIFILANGNSDTIKSIEKVLIESGYFSIEQ